MIKRFCFSALLLALALGQSSCGIPEAQAQTQVLPPPPPLRIYDEGTRRDLSYKLNFAGAGVSCPAPSSGMITCTIPGGGATGLQPAYLGAATPADNIMLLTSTDGPVIARDNATPIGQLFSIQNSAGTTKYFDVTSTGASFRQRALTSGAPFPTLDVYSAAHTGLTAGTEINLTYFDGSSIQWATGALANERWNWFHRPTLNFVGASTVTNAATMYVSGAPIAGVNATITNPYALWIDDGVSRFDGNVQAPAIVNGAQSITINDGSGVVINGHGGYVKAQSDGVFLGGDGVIADGQVQISSAVSYNTAGGVLLGISEPNFVNDHVFYGMATSASAGLAAIGEYLAADTSGTTVNKLVVWSGAQKVQIPAATANLRTIAGVAATTTASGGRAKIARRGRAYVDCSGVVAAGDLLVSDEATAGNVKTNNTAAAGTIVGRATEACGGTIAGKVQADLTL